MPTSSKPLPTLAQIKQAVKERGSPEKAAFAQRFFKTGAGEYGEGDRFAGLTVPMVRGLLRRFAELPLAKVERLLASPIHEERLLAVLLLSRACQRGSQPQAAEARAIYLRRRERVNSWDLVDVSAEHILGPRIVLDGLELLRSLAGSDSVWDRRIAMLATFYEIRRRRFAPALEIAHILHHDKHDLIQKAVGWMLREIGKRELEAEERFLRAHAGTMPRTMLHYAIERLPLEKRKQYLGLRAKFA